MLKLGYAEADITPERGEDLCGFALRKPGSIGVHDPLKVRWLYLTDDRRTSVLLGSADIISLSRNSYDDIRRKIQDELGVAVPIALATTHTHSGPVTVTLRNCGRLNKSYMARLKDTICRAALDAAKASLCEVEVKTGLADSDEAENRRQGDNGPVDHEVFTVSFVDRMSGKTKATIVNYACHPVVLGHGSNFVSADYPGYLASFIQKQTGAPALFLNGAAGDQNPRCGDHGTNPQLARQIGESIGRTALEAVAVGARLPHPELAWHKKSIQLPVYQFQSPAELESRLAMIQKTFGFDRSLFADRVARDVQRIEDGRYPKWITLELSLLTIGANLGILFVPGELFCSIGLKFKNLFGPRKLLISGFSNGSVGYLPDRQAYADGGYEPYFANFFYDFPQFDPGLEDVLLSGVAALSAKVSTPDIIKSA